MILTDKFVFLHYPKTGGTFVEAVLLKLHEKINSKCLFRRKVTCRQLMHPNLKRLGRSEVYNPHGVLTQIPDDYKEKPVVSCMRNPFDFYVSHYEYKSWRQGSAWDLFAPEIKTRFPEFPDLSFEQYLAFIEYFESKTRTINDGLQIDIGMMTYTFIQFFFKDPLRMFHSLDENYAASGAFRNDMPEVRFLKTENLNFDLFNYLIEFGYREKDISFIKDEEKINMTSGRPGNKRWSDYYSADLYKYVKFKERLILQLFPEYADLQFD